MAEIIEYGDEAKVAMLGKFQRLAFCIQQPTEEDFGCGPETVALKELLDGDGLLMDSAVGGQWSEDLVNGMKEQTACEATSTTGALNEIAKIIDVDVGVLQWLRERLRRRDVNRWERGRKVR